MQITLHMLLSACGCFLLKNHPPDLSIFYDGLFVPYLTNPHPQPSGWFSRILVPSPLTRSLILGFPHAGHGLTAVIFYLQHSVDNALEIAFLGPRGPPSTAFQVQSDFRGDPVCAPIFPVAPASPGWGALWTPESTLPQTMASPDLVPKLYMDMAQLPHLCFPPHPFP